MTHFCHIGGALITRVLIQVALIPVDVNIRTSYLERNKDHPYERKTHPNPSVGSHEILLFGMRTAGIKTHLIRATPQILPTPRPKTQDKYLIQKNQKVVVRPGVGR